MVAETTEVKNPLSNMGNPKITEQVILGLSVRFNYQRIGRKSLQLDVSS